MRREHDKKDKGATRGEVQRDLPLRHAVLKMKLNFLSVNKSFNNPGLLFDKVQTNVSPLTGVSRRPHLCGHCERGR